MSGFQTLAFTPATAYRPDSFNSSSRYRFQTAAQVCVPWPRVWSLIGSRMNRPRFTFLISRSRLSSFVDRMGASLGASYNMMYPEKPNTLYFGSDATDVGYVEIDAGCSSSWGVGGATEGPASCGRLCGAAIRGRSIDTLRPPP